MAGYRRADAGHFTNATTINDQIARQREEYQGRLENAGSERGIARDTKPLFSNMPNDIFSLSVKEFKGLDSLAAGGNPDFGPTGVKLENDREALFADVAKRSDKPNEKGPNLVAPDINNLSAVTTDQQTSQFNERGFGWRDGRNEPATETARIGTYFSRHYNAEGTSENKPILGEAKSPLDDTNIDYNQPE